MRNKNTTFNIKAPCQSSHLNFIRFHDYAIDFDLYILNLKVWECNLFDPKKCIRAKIF